MKPLEWPPDCRCISTTKGVQNRKRKVVRFGAAPLAPNPDLETYITVRESFVVYVFEDAQVWHQYQSGNIRLVVDPIRRHEEGPLECTDENCVDDFGLDNFLDCHRVRTQYGMSVSALDCYNTLYAIKTGQIRDFTQWRNQALTYVLQTEEPNT